MEQSQPAARGQSLLEWYEALISAALEARFGLSAASASILRTEFLTADKQKFQ